MKRVLERGLATMLSLALVCAPLLTVGVGTAQAATSRQEGPQQEGPGIDGTGTDGAGTPALRLKVGTFTPAASPGAGTEAAQGASQGAGQGAGRGTTLGANLPPGLTVAAQNSQHWIVQFDGPILSEWRAALEGQGAEVLAYLPDFAYKVRMNPGQAKKVEELPDVVYVGPFEPALKLAPPVLASTLAGGGAGGAALYRVRVESGRDWGLTNAAIATTGAQIVSRDGDALTVVADAGQVQAIAQVVEVAWVENWLLREKHNEVGGGQIIGGAAANASGYDGSTQIAAVADTGFGGGTTSSVHPDIPAGRVVALQNFAGTSSGGCYTVVNDGPVDVDSGHGTHVAGSVLSDGGPNGEGKGVAPAARFVGQAVENFVDFSGLCAAQYADGYYLMGIPDDLNTLFGGAYTAGARIHSNSWGSAAAGDYTLDSGNADKFVWTNKDMAITFSAGNEGIDANADGVVDNDSTGSPATAKNVITIGASENQRPSYPCDTGLGYTSRDATYQNGQTCGSMGGNNLLGTYGQRWGADYPAPPLAGDPTAGNMEQMAAFSSRGPTDDGRIKPDVVAPGTWILSTYSDLYQEGYDGGANPRNNLFQSDGWGLPSSGQYKYFGGTSMSNPLAGGAATVLRDYYQKAKGIGASAALVKATLINTAVDLGDENNDGANDNDFPIPNVHEGWGRINLSGATDGSVNFVEAPGLATNGSAVYNVTPTGAGPLKISMVWSDFQSTETAAVNLVNDLDLIVTAPGGAVYRGNVFGGGWSQAGGNADRRNNVENVFVAAPGAGTWSVEVRGYNVPSGPQPYALVVDNGTIGAAPPPPSVPVHVGDLDGSKVLGSRNWSATATVTVHNGSEAPVNGATVTGNWTGAASGSTSCTTNGSGVCAMTKGNLKNNAASATFTVTGITGAGLTYAAGANHDVDGGTNGTVVTIAR
jgi:subtilisin family serine protease